MKINRFLIYLLIGFLTFANLGSILPPSQPTPPPKFNATEMNRIAALVKNGDVQPDEVVVRLHSNTTLASVEKCAGIFFSSDPNQNQVGNIAQVIHLKANSLIDALPAIQNCPGVMYAEPNYMIHSSDTIPNDPNFSSRQYGLTNIRAPEGWDYSTGSNTVTIAIIDSGVDLAHPDLAGKIVAGYDYVNDDSIPQDDFGHGTHVAGIAAAVTNNNYGIAGVSWGALIMPLKVLDSYGNGYTSDSALAIKWAADNGAKVINMSFGSSSVSLVMLEAINYAYSKGVVMVAASGNDGISGVLYPASYDHVIAVGATDSNNARASFSNYGSELDLVAPGVNIYSTLENNGFGYKSGTSMATPFVAGLAAILSSLPGEFSPEVIEQTMVNSALDLGVTGKDNYYGHGLIQVNDSILQLLPPTPFSKLSPVNSIENESTELLFSWENSTFATSYEYCIDTSNDGTCGNSWIMTNQDISTGVNLLSNITYNWQVRAVNAVGITYADSNQWWTFTTKSCSTLTTSVEPIDGGSIGLDPEPDCQIGTKYSDNTLVTLSPNPASNYFQFAGWSDGISDNTNPTIINMNTDMVVSALFEKATFADVPFNYSNSIGEIEYPLQEYIQAFWNAGYTAGCNTNPLSFCPDMTMTRAESAVFMLRGNFGSSYIPPEEPWDTFADDWSPGTWAEKWAEGMWNTSLTAGCQQDPLKFCPWDQFSREQAAVFGLRLKYNMSYIPPTPTVPLFADMTDTSYWSTKWAEQAYLDGLLPACGTQDGKPLFCPTEPVTRAWSAYMIVKAKDLPLP